MLPAWSMMVTLNSYSDGFSALHGSRPCRDPLANVVLASALVEASHTTLPSESFNVAEMVAAAQGTAADITAVATLQLVRLASVLLLAPAIIAWLFGAGG